MRKPTDTKERLLETAIELIWQSNYTCVGVNDICKQAGVTKGSFYHYFESKADLFCEASRHHWEEIKKELDAAFSPSHSALEQLDTLLCMVIEMQEARQKESGNPVSGCPFFTSGGQAGAGEEKIRIAAQEISGHALKYYAALVRNLKEENILNGNPDPMQIGRMLFQYVQGLLIYGRVYRSLEVVKVDLKEAIYRLIDIKPEYRK